MTLDEADLRALVRLYVRATGRLLSAPSAEPALDAIREIRILNAAASRLVGAPSPPPSRAPRLSEVDPPEKTIPPFGPEWDPSP